MNPYQAPAYLDESHLAVSSIGGRANGFPIFATGQLVLCSASLLILIRCFIVLDGLDLWRVSVFPGASYSQLAGVFALALASWIGIALFGYVRKHASPNQSTYCYAMILIAMCSIFVRATLEPATAWTPTWPNYLLTMAAIVALAVLRRQLVTK